MSRVLLSRPRTAAFAGAALATAVVGSAVLAGPASAATTAYVVTGAVAVGGSPSGVGVDPSTHTAYVANADDNTVSVIDGATNTVTTTIQVGSNPFGVAVDPSTHTVYVTNFGGSSVSVIDGSTNTVTDTVGVGSAPYAVAVDPSTHKAYVANYFDDSVLVITGTSNTATVEVGRNPRAIAVDPSTHTVFATNYNADSVSVIDGTTNQVTSTVTGVADPIGVAVDPSTHAAYVATYFGNSIVVIDGTTRQVTGSFGVGIHPYGVAVDPSNHTVYAANRVDNTVSVVDGTMYLGLATLAVGTSPIAMAVDPAAHTAYAADNDVSSDSVSIISAGNVPAVSGVSPASGTAAGGQSVTVTGTDLTGATTVTFGSTAATSFTVDSSTQITAVAPAHAAGAVDVRVTTTFGTSPTSSADGYTFVASPTLDTTPSTGTPAGGTISDSAVISGGSSPSGTVPFSLFGPADPSCAGTPLATNTAAVSGAAADSGAVTVTGAGTYRWTASYSGDAINQPASSGCGDDTVVTAAALNRLVATPTLATVVAGGSQAFTVEGFDAYSNSRGDVTADTTFSVVGGACDGATCTPRAATGRYQVTASSGAATATATVRVTPAALDHLVVTPRLATVVAGGSQTFAVTAYDAHGNVRAKVAAALSIGGGSCVALTCTPPTTVGRYTVTASFGGVSATATVRVTPAAFDHLNIAPGSTSVVQGASQAYLVSAYDRYGNFRVKVPASLTVSGGSCDGLTCTPSTRTGRYAVTATFGGKSATATLRVTKAAGQASHPGW